MTCEQMDTETYPDPRVREALSGWVVKRVEISTHRDVATRYGVVAIPVAIALSGDGHELGRIENFVSAEKFVQWLGAWRSTKER